ncbi:hypothetical protein E2C01_095802 [Portunus trituberculatus]|uniref:Uncharacterized protein n=1 Tax=Portunus trituberculatus TaxID=210409 RepID=A0A5B7K0C7_PORTR|nr:hypothetical protein [Portunus trituberculatus]
MTSKREDVGMRTNKTTRNANRHTEYTSQQREVKGEGTEEKEKRRSKRREGQLQEWKEEQ